MNKNNTNFNTNYQIQALFGTWYGQIARKKVRFFGLFSLVLPAGIEPTTAP